MPSVHSRPLIENDGNNLALRRVLRLLKRAILRGRDLVIEGGMITEEFLDTVGLLVVKLLGLIGYPLTVVLPRLDMFDAFTGKALPQTLPLIFVLHIILLVYSTYVLCYLPAVGLGFTSTESVVFHAVTILSIISYYRGVASDPGSIPSGPDWEKGRLGAKEQGLRFCQREKKYKPERTHYCSAMGRNVLKMDHYCPWLANCVGFFNYKYFLLFVTYASVACGWTTISVARLLAASSGGFLGQLGALSAAQIFFLTEGLCISSLISLILTPFAGFHWYLMSQNKTTLEYCEKAHSEASYDQGFFGNFFSVFGYNPFLWFIPVHSTPGTGLDFERVSEHSLATPPSSDEDEEEDRVKKEFAALAGSSEKPAVPGSRRGCCIRRWDDADSPLWESRGISDIFWGKCIEVNEFRERLVAGFANIFEDDSKEEGGGLV